MSQNTPLNTQQRLKQLYAQTHERRLSLQGWFRLSTLASILALCWVALMLLEHFFYLPSFAKIGGILASIGLALGVFFKYTSFNRLAFRDHAKQISKATKQSASLDYLDLHQKEHPTEVEQLALSTLEKEIDLEKVQQTFQQWMNQLPELQKYRQRITWASATLLVCLSLSMSWLHSDAKRLISFWQDSIRPNPYTYKLLPNTKTIAEGQKVQFGVIFEDLIPNEVQFFIKSDNEQEFRTYTPTNQANQQFTLAPEEVFSSRTFYVRMDGFVSDTLNLDVLPYPLFEGLKLIVKAPEYLQRPYDTLSYPFELVRLAAGSEINLEAQPNVELSSLLINSTSRTKPDTATWEKNLWKWQFTTSLEAHSDSLSFDLIAQNGLKKANDYPFILQTVEDQRPQVRWIQPQANKPLKAAEPMELVYQATDDYALRTVQIRYELRSTFGKIKLTDKIMVRIPDLSGISSHILEASTFERINPKDELILILDAWDNDQPNGFKRAVADTLVLIAPSLLAELDNMMDAEQDLEERFDQVQSTQEQRERLSDEMKRGLKENPEQAWRQQRNVQQQMEAQQELEKEVEELNQRFEELKKQMEDSEMLSPETMKAFEDYKKLIEELKDTDLMDALQKMQESLKNINPQEFRQSLENLEFNEEVYKERLERTIELFKKLKTQAKMERMAKALEQMADKQEEVADEAINPAAQEELKEALEKVQEDTESLTKDAPKRQQEDVKELSEAMQQEQKQLQQQMEKLLEQMQQSQQPSDAEQQQMKQQQQNMAKKMRQMQQKISEQIEAMNGKQLTVNIEALKGILNGLLLSSNLQEDLHLQTLRLEERSAFFVEQARDQKAINDYYSTLSDSLLRVGNEIPELDNEVLKRQKETARIMKRALEQQSEREKMQASVLERQSLGGINDMGQLVADLLEQLQNQQNGSGGGQGGMNSQQMMEQLQQMGQQQQQINQQLQQMINDMAGERLSMDQAERLEQLSKQQNDLRKQLEELKQQGSIQDERLKSQLQRLENEMEDAVRDLRGGVIDPLTVQRQQNILSRMLDAQRATQEQGEEDKREGEQARDRDARKGPELPLEELKKLLEKQLQSKEYSPYKNDLEQLIRRYFERLQNQQTNEL